MRYSYVLYFNNSRPSKLDLLYELDRELKSFGINNEFDVKKTNQINVLYQNKEYEIIFKKHENFPQSLHIRTDEKYNLKSRKGFITLIWRMMNWRFNVEYGQMEILKKDSFQLINERIKDRFINQVRLHSIFEKKFIPIDIKLTYEKQDGGLIEVIRGQISEATYSSTEEAWASIAHKLDYDGWDTVNSEFIPVTIEEYREETTGFMKSWNMKDGTMNLENEMEVISILKIEKTKSFIEFLIKKEGFMEYISIDVYLG